MIGPDRVGLGWRPELAAGIHDAFDQIDVLEVIAESCFETSRATWRGLRSLGREIPLQVHSIALGLAGATPVDQPRLDRVARLVNAIEPEGWSEHLCFMRAGGIEIGHLAPPPRNAASVAAATRNIRAAAAVIGALPEMENIATLLQPPLSPLSEPAWISAIVETSGCGLLLDLHNLLANAVNFGGDPLTLLAELPLHRVRTIHIAGGKWITSPGGRRVLLDDHLHAVADPVYDLLAEVAARTAAPLTVILERDGVYPAMDVLLAELDRARAAVAAGRARRREQDAPSHAG
jgi:uncharacterized protein (UPF0276 family)